jgi:hypothetical protein
LPALWPSPIRCCRRRSPFHPAPTKNHHCYNGHVLEETRQYIRDFDRLAETTTTARELYDQMLKLYPDRVNPGALWLSARGVKP